MNQSASLASLPNFEEELAESPSSGNREQSLLLKIQYGDEAALAVLYQAHSRIIYSVALRILRDVPAAEDVLQDVFLNIWRKPSTFLTKGEMRPGWWAIIARNRAIDVLRTQRPAEKLDDVSLPADDDVFENVECRMKMRRALLMLRNLPSKQQEALDMAFFKGWTYEEIADYTGDPLGTIKSRIRDALLKLRKAARSADI